MSKEHGHWIDSLSGKNAKLEKRFGVSPVRMSKMDGGTWQEDKENRENYSKNMIEGARNDYDLRRTVEAAAMSGKKKAIKLQKKGFKDIDDVRKWQNFSEKAAKRHGQGGDFADASDYMGLTKSMVQRDRRKFSDGLATIDDMNALRDDLEQQEEASNHQQQQPMEKSDALARAEDRLAEAEQGIGGIYRQSNGPAATDSPARDASKAFLYDYKDKVKEKYGPLTNTEREVSNAAKRVQDPFGR